MKAGIDQRFSLLFRFWGWIAQSHDIDRASDGLATQNNMTDRNDLFFFGDEFDAILDVLEEEEGLQEQFNEVANGVS